MDSPARKKILVLVEGEKSDVLVMEKLFEIYSELDAKYQIISYRTNIYVLYGEFFHDDEDEDDYDLLQVLKSREHDPEKKKILDDKYTDILLIFDLDPQDQMFTEDKIRRMQAYFCESSDMGKLYLNYPMIEAFFHMPVIPDADYTYRTTTMTELICKKYKERVNRESRGKDYRKFITSRKDSNYVILENIRKAFMILDDDAEVTDVWRRLDLDSILSTQLKCLCTGYLHVLCTCVVYIYDYNSALLFQN